MERQIFTFRELIAPLEPEVFFGEVYRRRPLSLTGPDDRFDRVFSWEALNELLSMTTLWSDQSCEVVLGGKVLPPEAYCYEGPTRDNQRGHIVDPERMLHFLRQGGALTLNFIERLTPPLRALSQTLACVLGASVNCSTFVTWPRAQGYASHFDTTQVVVLHIAGIKTWRIYEGRFPHAAHTANARAKYPDYPQDYHDKAKGALVEEVTLRPGDLLYLPHGQYHDAFTTEEPSIHLSFAVRHLVAQDFVNALSRELPQDPTFLQHLPEPGDAAANSAARRSLAGQIERVLGDPKVGDGLETLLRRSAFERIASYRLPDRAPPRGFRVRWLGRRVEASGPARRLIAGNAAHELDPTAGALAEWALARDYFAESWLEEDFSHLRPDVRAAGLANLSRLGLIEAL